MMARSTTAGLLLILAAGGCSRDGLGEHPSARDEATTKSVVALPRGASHHGGVSTYSSLPALFGGQVGSHLVLNELSPKAASVGVGSLSELQGEITIFDGEIWVSYPDVAEARRAKGEQAAFLAVARIDSWKAVTLKQEVSWPELPKKVAQAARELGFAENEAVAVRIEGRVRDVEFNVVNGRALGIGGEPSQPLSKEELSRTATKRRFAEARALIAGFYARDGQAFIHRGQKLHLHVIVPDVKQMGHLDGVTLPGTVSLQLGRPLSEQPKRPLR